MNISEAADAAGLPVKTVRYYDDIGLVVADRSSNGYRNYSDNHVNRLRFLQRSRSLGFSIEDCRSLLSLYDDADRASADVKKLAQARIDEIEEKIRQLGSLRDTLSELVNACHGDARPDCPIIADLAGGPARLNG
ncbi:Cu(I)-responsive transcriptional regulator [Granulosicoccaceae sp. 1_MG-2023]|nr:Cu(I)-responsive transcriptional regulator [Granulosicoccaceae sp. 1_MG-2023]